MLALVESRASMMAIDRTRRRARSDIGSGIATLALFVSAALSSWRAERRFRRSSWAVVALAVVVQFALLEAGPEVGGIRQRVLLGLCCGWQIELVRRDH